MSKKIVFTAVLIHKYFAFLMRIDKVTYKICIKEIPDHLYPNYHKVKSYFIISVKLMSITGIPAATLVSSYLDPLFH